MAVPRDPELRELSERFVRVRLIQMGGVDQSLFQFDPFLSWSLFFLHPDRTIYGRYGRAHPDTKRGKKDSNPNPSLAAMKAAMRKALALHESYTGDPKGVGPSLAGKTGPAPRWKYTEQTPAARKYGRLKRVAEGEEQGCIHCHEVQRARIDSLVMEKRRIPDRELWMYPRPEVLGLTLGRDHVARVTAVAAGSDAAKAGIRVGDDLTSADGQPLVSVADLQWVLHQFADAGGALAIELERGGKPITVKLDLPKDWRRREDFVWRYRLAGYASWLWTGAGYRDDPTGIVVDHLSPNWWKNPNQDGRRTLRKGDVIVAVDGKKGLDRSGFLAYLMRDKKLGSKLELTLLRGGKEIEVDFKLPKKQPEVLGH